MDTCQYGNHPDHGFDPEYSLAIRLHRLDKTWILSWSCHSIYHNDQLGEKMDWQPLKEAPLKIKIAAVKIFPNLLEAIEKSQIQLAEEIKRATAEFDAFAQTLPRNEKERA